MHPFQLNRPQRVTKRFFSTACVLLLILNMLALAVQPAVAAQPADPSAPPTAEQLARFYKSASKPGATLGETFHLHHSPGSELDRQLAVDVKDPLPPRLDYVPGSANDGGNYDPLTRSLSWTRIPVTPAASVNLAFQVVMSQTVDCPTPTVNTAYISWDGFVLQREAWVTLLPNSGSGQGLQASFKSADPRLAGPGGKVVYTIHLLNDSTDVLTATVTDPVPTPLTYVDGSVSDGGSYDPATHTVTWKNLVVPPDSSTLPLGPLALTFAALAPTIIPASLYLQIVTSTAEIATANLTFTRSADILLTPQTISPLAGSFKDFTRRVVVPGEVFTYTIELNNSSPVPVPAVVTDTVPTQVTYVDGSANADGAYDPATHTLTWTNLTVPAASSLTLTFAVTRRRGPPMRRSGSSTRPTLPPAASRWSAARGWCWPRTLATPSPPWCIA